MDWAVIFIAGIEAPFKIVLTTISPSLVGWL
jgi:hypothetical protein